MRPSAAVSTLLFFLSTFAGVLLAALTASQSQSPGPGTFLPFVVLSLVFSRTSYLYYMVVVMPAIYLAAADLVVRLRRYRKLLWLWAVLVVGAAVVMYPITPLP